MRKAILSHLTLAALFSCCTTKGADLIWSRSVTNPPATFLDVTSSVDPDGNSVWTFYQRGGNGQIVWINATGNILTNIIIGQASLAFVLPSNISSNQAVVLMRTGLDNASEKDTIIELNKSGNQISALYTPVQGRVSMEVQNLYTSGFLTSETVLAASTTMIRSYRYGTHLTATLSTTGNVRVDWQSFPGQSFQMQSSADLRNWTNTGGVYQGDGNSLSFEEKVEGKNFFRLKVE